MARLSLGTGLLLGCLSASCMPLEEDIPEGSDVGKRAATTDETPKVGDSVDAGQVTEVDPLGQNCSQVIVEQPAKWSCSEAQIREASGSGLGGGGLPSAQPPVKAAAAVLTATDCAGLAALRRPNPRGCSCTRSSWRCTRG